MAQNIFIQKGNNLNVNRRIWMSNPFYPCQKGQYDFKNEKKKKKSQFLRPKNVSYCFLKFVPAFATNKVNLLFLYIVFSFSANCLFMSSVHLKNWVVRDTLTFWQTLFYVKDSKSFGVIFVAIFLNWVVFIF